VFSSSALVFDICGLDSWPYIDHGLWHWSRAGQQIADHSASTPLASVIRRSHCCQNWDFSPSRRRWPWESLPPGEAG
jgi:hypothetical protein